MRLSKKIIFIFFFTSTLFAQITNTQGAKGLFMSISVGPKFPIGVMSEKFNAAPSFDFSISYTNTEFTPLFFYFTFGYQSHSGNFNFYKTTKHSSVTSNIFSLNLGGKYFFEPILDEGIIIMPVVELGATYGFIKEYYQYKIYLNLNDKLQNLSKFGGHIGVGISFFLLELMGTYCYLPQNQFFGINLKLTMPLTVSF